jgi:hypothetical protein
MNTGDVMPRVTAVVRTGLLMAAVWLAATGGTDRDIYAQGPSDQGFRLVRVRVFDGFARCRTPK